MPRRPRIPRVTSVTPFNRSNTPSIPQKQPPARTAVWVPIPEMAGSFGGPGNSAAKAAAVVRASPAAHTSIFAILMISSSWLRMYPGEVTERSRRNKNGCGPAVALRVCTYRGPDLRTLAHGARAGTEQNHLFDGRGQQELWPEDRHQGYLPFLFLRGEDRGHRTQRIGEELAAADHGGRGHGVPGGDHSQPRLHGGIPRAGAPAPSRQDGARGRRGRGHGAGRPDQGVRGHQREVRRAHGRRCHE